jgi:hypothetical protein
VVVVSSYSGGFQLTPPYRAVGERGGQNSNVAAGLSRQPALAITRHEMAAQSRRYTLSSYATCNMGRPAQEETWSRYLPVGLSDLR